MPTPYTSAELEEIAVEAAPADELAQVDSACPPCMVTGSINGDDAGTGPASQETWQGAATDI